MVLLGDRSISSKALHSMPICYRSWKEPSAGSQISVIFFQKYVFLPFSLLSNLQTFGLYSPTQKALISIFIATEVWGHTWIDLKYRTTVKRTLQLSNEWSKTYLPLLAGQIATWNYGIFQQDFTKFCPKNANIIKHFADEAQYLYIFSKYMAIGTSMKKKLAL